MSLKRAALAFLLALCLLGLERYVSHRTTNQYLRKMEGVNETLSILLSLHGIFDAVQQADGAQRLYLMKSDPGEIEKFEQAKAELARHLAAVRKLDHQDAYMIERVAEAETYANEKMALVGQIISRQQRGDTAAVEQLQKDPRGRLAVLRRIIIELQRHENQELSVAQAQMTSARRQGMIASYAITLFEVGLLTFAFLAIARYANASRKVQESLLKTTAVQQAIFDAADYSIISCSPDGTIQTFNHAAERWLGYEARELIGRLTPQVFHDPHEIALRAAQLARELGRQVKADFDAFVAKARLGLPDEREWTYVRKDGSRFPVLLSVTAIRDAQGRITGFLGIASDLSERHRFAQELKAAKEAAETSSRTKSAFLANMSHELRTPLNAIIGYSEMLKEEAEAKSEAQVAQDAERIRAAGQQLLALISDVLDLSKVEAGKMSLFVETFSAAQLVRDVASTVRPLVEKNHNRFEVICPDDLGDMHADAAKLRQVLYNLLTNAGKFTEAGVVGFEASREHPERKNGNGNGAASGDIICFTIRDTGIGMTRQQMQNLFEPFTQAEPATSSRFGGTGLGLAISRQFCRMMDGDITAHSTPGSGSTFVVRIPAMTAQAQAAETQ